jgi:hypothetical protein
MVTHDTIRRLALAHPGAQDKSTENALKFTVDKKLFAWSYLARAMPKAPRRPVLQVLTLRCPVEKKEILIAAAPERFFDDGHYLGCPALLVRLAAIEENEFAALLAEAWRYAAPRALTRKCAKPGG